MPRLPKILGTTPNLHATLPFLISAGPPFFGDFQLNSLFLFQPFFLQQWNFYSQFNIGAIPKVELALLQSFDISFHKLKQPLDIISISQSSGITSKTVVTKIKKIPWS